MSYLRDCKEHRRHRAPGGQIGATAGIPAFPTANQLAMGAEKAPPGDKDFAFVDGVEQA